MSKRLYIVSIPITVYREERIKKNICHDLGSGTSLDLRVGAEDARDAVNQARLVMENLVNETEG